jgi:hypothetical protein
MENALLEPKQRVLERGAEVQKAGVFLKGDVMQVSGFLLGRLYVLGPLRDERHNIIAAHEYLDQVRLDRLDGVRNIRGNSLGTVGKRRNVLGDIALVVEQRRSRSSLSSASWSKPTARSISRGTGSADQALPPRFDPRWFRHSRHRPLSFEAYQQGSRGVGGHDADDMHVNHGADRGAVKVTAVAALANQRHIAGAADIDADKIKLG